MSNVFVIDVTVCPLGLIDFMLCCCNSVAMVHHYTSTSLLYRDGYRYSIFQVTITAEELFYARALSLLYCIVSCGGLHSGAGISVVGAGHARR